MPLPPSVTRITKNGIEFVSNVDRVNYTMKELCRAALRDVGKFVCITSNKAAQKLYYNSMKKSKRVRGSKGAFQYWARKQELGSSKMKKHGILTNSVQDNIATIIKIESQYLSALEDEAEALALISDKEYQGGGDDD